MDSKGEPILAVVIAWIFGLVMYIVVADKHRDWPIKTIGVLFAVGAVGLIVGLLVMRRNAWLSVFLISLWPLATIAIASSVTAVACWGVVSLSHVLDALPKSQRDPLAEFVSGVVTGLAGILFLTKLADKTSWLWPAAPTRFAFKRTFPVTSGTREYDAIYEQHVRGPSAFDGWGIVARFRRAKALSRKKPAAIDVQPPTSRVGDIVRVTRTNLLPTAVENATPTVSVGGVQASGVTLPGPPDTIEFTVPAPASGAWAPDVAQQVKVTTTAGVATLNGALRIVEDQPLISHVTPSRFKAGEQTTVCGSFLLAPGTPSGNQDPAADSIGRLIGEILDATGTISWPIEFVGPYSNTAIEVSIGSAVSPVGRSAPTVDTPATLRLSRTGKQATASVTIVPPS